MTSVRALYDAAHGIVSTYERHLSAAAMLVGFGLDSYTFGRVDRPAANIVFCAYLTIAWRSSGRAHNRQQRMDRRVARIQKLAAMQNWMAGARNRGHRPAADGGVVRAAERHQHPASGARR